MARPAIAAPLHLRIFLSSPGDVPEERTFARNLIKNRLPNDAFIRGRVTFEPVSWDDPESGTPMLGNLTPQACVNRCGPRPSECHIVVVVLWSRFGTPLDPAFGTRANGEPYLSGTEWEYEDALNADPPPDLLVYRCAKEPLIRLKDPDRAEKDQHSIGSRPSSPTPRAFAPTVATRTSATSRRGWRTT